MLRKESLLETVSLTVGSEALSEREERDDLDRRWGREVREVIFMVSEPVSTDFGLVTPYMLVPARKVCGLMVSLLLLLELLLPLPVVARCRCLRWSWRRRFSCGTRVSPATDLGGGTLAKESFSDSVSVSVPVIASESGTGRFVGVRARLCSFTVRRLASPVPVSTPLILFFSFSFPVRLALPACSALLSWSGRSRTSSTRPASSLSRSSSPPLRS